MPPTFLSTSDRLVSPIPPTMFRELLLGIRSRSISSEVILQRKVRSLPHAWHSLEEQHPDCTLFIFPPKVVYVFHRADHFISQANSGTFQVTVNATQPMWFFCQVTGHCSDGMVGRSSCFVDVGYLLVCTRAGRYSPSMQLAMLSWPSSNKPLPTAPPVGHLSPRPPPRLARPQAPPLATQPALQTPEGVVVMVPLVMPLSPSSRLS